jgi:transmembrane 9 superfamily member 3
MCIQVRWRPSEALFETRFDRYLDDSFFEHRIHWFSILNSFMLVMLLCFLVALILIRTLRNDFAKYTRDDQVCVR